MMERLWKQLMISTNAVWLIPSWQTFGGSGHTADPTSTADAILRCRPAGGVPDHGIDGRYLINLNWCGSCS
ncbi:hypothetical protein GE21DRAFT_1278954 [Neurospora crassa]|nr:hypothetical protein GE21DRAFT_1278954 [Neurospora crassa]